MEKSRMEEKDESAIMGFSRRTIEELKRAWNEFLGHTRRMLTGKITPDLTGGDRAYLKDAVVRCLMARGGEISCRRQAADLAMTYMNLNQAGREKFLNMLATEFQPDWNNIKQIYDRVNASPDEGEQLKLQGELAAAMIPPNIGLLKKFSSLPNGFKFLIDLRADLLPIRKSSPYLKKMDADIKSMLSSWFDVGLLDLAEITWQQSSAALLEKLIEYEAVHEITSWQDLKNRLDSDRYCFAFFHHKMPEEPLIFVEVALTGRIPDSIQALLDEQAETVDPAGADTAVFYSISNSQRGLSGISLGNFLIKRVVRELTQKLENLKHFVTLSPIPGFVKWLKHALKEGNHPILKQHQITERTITSFWNLPPDKMEELRPVLMTLCARYLVLEKRGEKCKDPVANFHLTNGAYLYRINWMGNATRKGMDQSLGIMANYYYDLSQIEKNHELYITKSLVQHGKDIKGWLK